MRMFFEILKGLIPAFLVAGALTIAIMPTVDPVFDSTSVNNNIRG